MPIDYSILYTINKKTKKSKCTTRTVDAHKASDQVEWKYMLLTIRDYGLGEHFDSLVDMLYAHKIASGLTNSDRPRPFNLTMVFGKAAL